MPLTIEQLRDIQYDEMADDLALADHMLEWTEDEARTYFQSGGFEVPEPQSMSVPCGDCDCAWGK